MQIFVMNDPEASPLARLETASFNIGVLTVFARVGTSTPSLTGGGAVTLLDRAGITTSSLTTGSVTTGSLKSGSLAAGSLMTGSLKTIPGLVLGRAGVGVTGVLSRMGSTAVSLASSSS